MNIVGEEPKPNRARCDNIVPETGITCGVDLEFHDHDIVVGHLYDIGWRRKTEETRFVRCPACGQKIVLMTRTPRE